MPWTDNPAVDGFDAILYMQDAAVTAAPGTGDEVGAVTNFKYTSETKTAEKGPYINSATVKNTIASLAHSFSFDVDVLTGTDTVRDAMWTAITGKTRKKFTFQLNPTTGEKFVYDQAILSAEGESNPAEGHTQTFNGVADSLVRTAASA